MGWSAARKLRRSVDGLTRVVAVEVLTAARALDLRAPLTPSPATGAVVRLLRDAGVEGPGPDRHLSPGDRDRRRSWCAPVPSLAAVEAVIGELHDHATNPRLPIHAAHGTELTARSWQTEAPLRMLMNNLDPENAERPEDLVVYGGTGKAARGLGVVRRARAHADARWRTTRRCSCSRASRSGSCDPRVGAAGADRELQPGRRLGQLGGVPPARGPRADDVRPDDGRLVDLHRHAGHPPGHLRDLRGGGRQAGFGGDARPGTITLTAGLGGMGGAQPLAVTMNDGVAICIECDQSRIDRRIEHRYLDVRADSLDARPRAGGGRPRRAAGALDRRARQRRRAAARAARVGTRRSTSSPTRPRRTTRCSTCRSAPRSRTGSASAPRTRPGSPSAPRSRWPRTCARWSSSRTRGAEVFDYGNSIRDEARKGGYDRAFDFPGFVPAYIRPLFCEGKGPFRWAALSGDPADIAATDRAILELFPDNERLRKWITMAGERVAFQGLPARICWLGYGERHLAGLRFNEMVASGELKAPIVIGRDHLDCGSVASPYRETEAMLDGSDAIADWPLLNALVNTASGATWVSIHHGGGVGIGRLASTPARSASPTAPTSPRRRSSGC